MFIKIFRYALLVLSITYMLGGFVAANFFPQMPVTLPVSYVLWVFGVLCAVVWFILSASALNAKLIHVYLNEDGSYLAVYIGDPSYRRTGKDADEALDNLFKELTKKYKQIHRYDYTIVYHANVNP